MGAGRLYGWNPSITRSSFGPKATSFFLLKTLKMLGVSQIGKYKFLTDGGGIALGSEDGQGVDNVVQRASEVVHGVADNQRPHRTRSGGFLTWRMAQYCVKSVLCSSVTAYGLLFIQAVISFLRVRMW